MRLEFKPRESRLGFEGGTEKKMEEKEKIPHKCESIGHRPLRGRCPKARKEEWKTRKRKVRERQRQKEANRAVYTPPRRGLVGRSRIAKEPSQFNFGYGRTDEQTTEF